MIVNFELQASIDEAAIWTRQLTVNMTHDETLYFLGGYVKDLEDMSAAKFAEMLKNVDMSDPDQAAAAGAMSNKLMSNEKVETTTTTTTAAPAPAPAAGGGAAAAGGGGGGTPTTTSNPGELAQAQGGAQAPHKLGWKESEKLKQLLLYDLYKVSC